MGFRQLLALFAISIISLNGCATSDNATKSESEIEEMPVESLYNEAADLFDNKQYEESTRLFEEVDRQHPYSKWATKAQVMAAYSYYKDRKYDEAVLALDRFIELHPGNEEVDYALYLRALCFYEQISDVARDQAMTEEALRSFDNLISRFPKSSYSRDAIYKRDLTLDHLAGKEMEIGRYYLNRSQINAAINRFLTVVKEYETTTHVQEALHRLTEAYLTLGLTGEATKVAAVLGHNYPGSPWYEKTYQLLDSEQRRQLVEGRSWIDRTVDSLFKPN